MIYATFSQQNISFVNGFMQNIKDMDEYNTAIFAFFLYIILLPIWAGLIKAFHIQDKLARRMFYWLTFLYFLAFAALKVVGDLYVSPELARDKITTHLRIQSIKGAGIHELCDQVKLDSVDIMKAINRFPTELYYDKLAPNGPRVVLVNFEADSLWVETRDENILAEFSTAEQENASIDTIPREVITENIRNATGVHPSPEAIEEFLNRQGGQLLDSPYIMDDQGNFIKQ